MLGQRRVDGAPAIGVEGRLSLLGAPPSTAVVWIASASRLPIAITSPLMPGPALTDGEWSRPRSASQRARPSATEPLR